MAQRLMFAVVAAAICSILAAVFLPDSLPSRPLLYFFTRILGAELILLFLFQSLIYPHYFHPLRHIPAPKGSYPFLGHFLQGLKRPQGQIFVKWNAETPKDGLLRIHGLFGSTRLVVTDPKALAEILNTRVYDFEKPKHAVRFLQKILGNGLIFVEGDEHKFLRKNVMPSFSFRHIKDLYPVFWKKSTQMVAGVTDELKEGAARAEKDVSRDGAVVEVRHWASRVTLDIIGLAAMGRDIQALRNSEDPLMRNYEELFKPGVGATIYFGLNVLGQSWLLKLLPLRMKEQVDRICGALHSTCLDMVQSKKQRLREKSDEKDDKLDILSLLINSNNFSDQELVDELLTFLAAGHETTSLAFTWTAYLLAMHKDVQTALREEIRANIPEPLPSSFDLPGVLESLPLLNGVCNESLRLYPTIPITVRVAVRPTVLCNTPIPAGTEVLIVPWSTNREPELWGQNAADFAPERWTDTTPGGQRRANNSGGASSNYAFLTFLHGSRSCIGQGFAKAELRCLVAAFVRNIVIEGLADLNQVVVPHGVITTKPKNGMRLRCTVLS